MASKVQKIFDEGAQPGGPEPFIRDAGDDLTRPATPAERDRSQTIDEARTLSPLADEETFQRLRRIMQERGREGIGDDWELRMAQLRKFRETNPKPEVAQAPPGPQQVVDNAQLTDNEPTLGDDITRRTRAAIEVSFTIGTGAIAEIPAGLSGLYSMLSSGGDVDKAKKNIDWWRDMLTFQPTKGTLNADTQGQMLETIVAPIVAMDNYAAKGAAVLSFGNAWAENAIYSTLTTGTAVGATLVGIKLGKNLKTPHQVKVVKAEAEKLGINVTQEGLAESVVRKATDMVPDVRAANADGLRAALLEAKAADEAAVAAARQTAQGSRAFVDVQEAATFAKNTTQQLLDDGFEIGPRTQAFLDDLGGLAQKSPVAAKPRGTPVVTARLQDVQAVINRIDRRLRSKKGGAETDQLNALKRKTEDWMDNQFNSDMISGNPDAIAAWKSFREAEGGSGFSGRKMSNVDKTIVQLMDAEATPEQIHRWLLGASATGAKPQAGATIRRIRELLGDDHPSIRGIQQDFLFEIAQPLLQETPNIRQFLTNWDKTMRNNPTLIEALGLNKSDMMPLIRFARVADALGPTKNINILGAPFLVAGGRYFAGHGIVKAGVRMKLITNLMQMAVGATKISQKQLFAQLAGIPEKGTFMNRTTAAAGRAIQASVVADLKGQSESR